MTKQARKIRQPTKQSSITPKQLREEAAKVMAERIEKAYNTDREWAKLRSGKPHNSQ